MNCGFLLRIVICSSVSSTPRDMRRVGAFNAAKSVGSNKFTKAKFFCGRPPKMALGRAEGSAKRTNRHSRFVFATSLEAVLGAVQRPRAAD
jgi:hypothetical protein